MFTACGTESNNWALAGAALAWRERHPGATPHVVASAVEHPAVTECLRALAGLVRSCLQTASARPADAQGHFAIQAWASRVRQVAFVFATSLAAFPKVLVVCAHASGVSRALLSFLSLLYYHRLEAIAP